MIMSVVNWSVKMSVWSAPFFPSATPGRLKIYPYPPSGISRKGFPLKNFDVMAGDYPFDIKPRTPQNDFGALPHRGKIHMDPRH
jgi:hypothetical protein